MPPCNLWGVRGILRNCRSLVIYESKFLLNCIKICSVKNLKVLRGFKKFVIKYSSFITCKGVLIIHISEKNEKVGIKLDL